MLARQLAPTAYAPATPRRRPTAFTTVYDASGLPQSYTSGTSYIWNVEQELSGFQQSGEPAWSYLYDGLGRRVEKLENGAVTAIYLRDRWVRW